MEVEATEDVDAEGEDDTHEEVETSEEAGGRYAELVNAGYGRKSISGPTKPIHRRPVGTSAAAAASALNTQQNYDIKGKTCLKCEVKFQAGKKIKTKVVKCTGCQGFVHENKKDCRVDITRGCEDFRCPGCVHNNEAEETNAVEESTGEDTNNETNEADQLNSEAEETNAVEDSTGEDTNDGTIEADLMETNVDGCVSYLVKQAEELVKTENKEIMLEVLEKIRKVPINIEIITKSQIGRKLKIFSN